MPAEIVLIRTADGRKLLVSGDYARKQMARSKGGRTTHARGHALPMTSERARAMITKRWAKHPPTGRGYRLGQRFTRRKNVPRAPLRDQHGVESLPVNAQTGRLIPGVYYRRFHVPAGQGAWVLVDDDYGTRHISELTALRRLGYLPRTTDTVMPVAIERRVK